MSEQPDKIEGRCWCGSFDYYPDLGRWVGSVPGAEYCPDCGYHLARNGFAYRMVRADRAAELEAELANLRGEAKVVFCPISDKDEYYLPADSGGECWGNPRFLLIPLDRQAAEKETDE